ncbi:hypothetical protein C1886_00215 [Pseudomonas sp. FW300-N1A1]|nr:hypothetical protein C1886_00215 [Pseudomonas sp. FW300-N1A1]
MHVCRCQICQRHLSVCVAGELAPAGRSALGRSSRKSANALLLVNRGCRFWGRFATQREQAPSPLVCYLLS